MIKRFVSWIMPFLAIVALLLTLSLPLSSTSAQTEDPNPPDQPVKLIFIHHSTGENWLTDGYGDLGKTLGENNYFVSDTNYGWGPDAIGDRTDIPNWTEWFSSPSTPTYMEALFNENEQNSTYTRTLSDPGGENQIILFKSCFPNSELEGSPNDPPGTYEDLTGQRREVRLQHHPDLFCRTPRQAVHRHHRAAALATRPTPTTRAPSTTGWSNDWLAENNYALNNVAVFDFYNVLTGSDAHHRWHNGADRAHPGQPGYAGLPLRRRPPLRQPAAARRPRNSSPS